MIVIILLVYEYDPQHLEAITLLDTKQSMLNLCSFKSEDELFEWIRALGCEEYMVQRETRPYPEDNELFVRRYSPYPFGNSFLLEYRLRSNNTGFGFVYALIK